MLRVLCAVDAVVQRVAHEGVHLRVQEVIVRVPQEQVYQRARRACGCTTYILETASDFKNKLKL